MKPKLHMYYNGIECVIAYDLEDAFVILQEQLGVADALRADDLHLIKDETATMWIFYDEKPTIDTLPPGAYCEQLVEPTPRWRVRSTYRDWIDFKGRCYFSTTKY